MSQVSYGDSDLCFTKGRDHWLLTRCPRRPSTRETGRQLLRYRPYREVQQAPYVLWDLTPLSRRGCLPWIDFYMRCSIMYSYNHAIHDHWITALSSWWSDSVKRSRIWSSFGTINGYETGYWSLWSAIRSTIDSLSTEEVETEQMVVVGRTILCLMSVSILCIYLGLVCRACVDATLQHNLTKQKNLKI